MRKKQKLLVVGLISILSIVLVFVAGEMVYDEMVGEKDVEEKIATREAQSIAYYHLSKIGGEWKRNGKYIVMSSDDTPIENGNYRNGLKEGNWCSYENGKLSSRTEFLGNKRNGVCEEYHVDGSVKSTGHYRNDNRVGLWKSLYLNKNVESLTNYSAGVREGQFVDYFENKVVDASGRYHNDRPDSVWTFNNESGSLAKKCYYTDGLLLKEETFRDNGIVICERIFHLDGAMESERYFDESGNDMISNLVGTYKDIDPNDNQDISTESMIIRSNRNLTIERSGVYLRKNYSYVQDQSQIFERTDNVKGIVRATSDSIYFIARQQRKYPARIFAPVLENRGWIDDSDKEWSGSSQESECYSIESFLSAYRKVR